MSSNQPEPFAERPLSLIEASGFEAVVSESTPGTRSGFELIEIHQTLDTLPVKGGALIGLVGFEQRITHLQKKSGPHGIVSIAGRAIESPSGNSQGILRLAHVDIEAGEIIESVSEWNQLVGRFRSAASQSEMFHGHAELHGGHRARARVIPVHGSAMGIARVAGKHRRRLKGLAGVEVPGLCKQALPPHSDARSDRNRARLMPVSLLRSVWNPAAITQSKSHQ